MVILVMVRRIALYRPSRRPRASTWLGALLSIVGMAMLVFGVLKSGRVGMGPPPARCPHLPRHVTGPVAGDRRFGGPLGLHRLVGPPGAHRGRTARPHAAVRQSPIGRRGAHVRLQFFIQAGVFFAVPLYLSVVLELSAVQTGVRLLPLSGALLIAALLVPKVFPRASPRRVVRIGFALMSVGILVLIGGISPSPMPASSRFPCSCLAWGSGAWPPSSVR